MTHPGLRRLLSAAIFVAAWLALPSAALATVAASYELSFELTAEVRTRRFDADLAASARLEMVAARRADGGLDLTLVRPLAPATKFYWIDPAGPFGEEAKLAAVVTLEAGSWEALARARRDVAELGAAAHERWRLQTGGDRALDGSFAFVVIGPATGRFQLSVDRDGTPRAVANELTERWLSGPFHDYVGRWGPGLDSAAAPRGYWFWNDGETVPFEFEPHVYHAFVEALDLLSGPRPAAGETAQWSGLAAQLTAVLVRLAPKAERGVAPSAQPVLLVGRETETGDAASTAGETFPRVVRRRTFTAEGVTADRVTVEWQERGLTARLAVGYRPLAESTAGAR